MKNDIVSVILVEKEWDGMIETVLADIGFLDQFNSWDGIRIMPDRNVGDVIIRIYEIESLYYLRFI